MILTYSRLRGLPVTSDDGRGVGRVLDVVVAPQDADMVVQALLVAPGRFALLAARFRPCPNPTTIAADRILAIDPAGVRVRGRHG